MNQEATIEELLPQQVGKELQVRAGGAQYLHDVTSDLEMHLDYFVMVSSSKAAWGSPNFASLNASCSYMDQLAVSRRDIGLPALSIQSGWLRGAGWLEDPTRNGSLKQFYNSSSLHISEFLAVLHKLIDQPDLEPIVMVANEVSINIFIHYSHIVKGEAEFEPFCAPQYFKF